MIRVEAILSRDKVHGTYKSGSGFKNPLLYPSRFGDFAFNSVDLSCSWFAVSGVLVRFGRKRLYRVIRFMVHIDPVLDLRTRFYTLTDLETSLSILLICRVLFFRLCTPGNGRLGQGRILTVRFFSQQLNPRRLSSPMALQVVILCVVCLISTFLTRSLPLSLSLSTTP
ncbi:uncharacterized protein LOC127795522 isoform X2 [Diospyros lotus]|uniref:uncharacterized protein LOC127795522 isoform X2 n=1 Tax=Diospyros lotus TaxID=55363 RepID=UPI00224F5845|nr:uncharacterized protein LOC127795522 isoform X2 [Diospyros lotus]